MKAFEDEFGPMTRGLHNIKQAQAFDAFVQAELSKKFKGNIWSTWMGM
jgi:hypothetical protein